MLQFENGDTTIDGGCIKTGKIESQDGKWWLNLETGEVHMEKGAFSGIIDWGSGGIYSENGAMQITGQSIDIHPEGSGQTAIKNAFFQNDIYTDGDKGITKDVPVRNYDNSGTRFLEVRNGLITGVHD